jgi:hypothetical protein
VIYVALLEGIAIVAIALSLSALVRSTQRQAARERDLLLNQMLNLVGRPWQTAPAETVPDVVPEDDGRYVLTPESLPDY